ncbi:antibiotic biosynthesis monooxygenase [Massilia sp. IC2-477]|uniref:putative quinol monooxygenase n=1 Tax=Massilia sp. IC2-477 TaxID=2887198 RepID=UPI001D12CEFE|nr:putative quinol monooxygenase [Massilia sp. IC2-477]MCC2954397.1 antibiotic biosynthesis monooxygenase [Massilia sp. IC2-477]
MTMNRRTAAKTLAALAALPMATQAAPEQKEATPMYGLIGKMRAQPGQRDALIAILLEGTGAMPGCLSYGIAKDKADPDAIWITETWDSQASHKASLSLPAVQAAIARGRPLIAGFGERFETEPVGGHGTMSKRSA